MNNWDHYQSTPKLLPPTVFEKTGDSSLPSQSSLNDDFYPTDSQILQFTSELDKLKDEIKKLHSENEALRHRNKDFIEQAQLYTEVSEHRKISITALEDLIHKQTKEIQNLKSELNCEKENSLIRNNSLESKYNQQIAMLTEQLAEANKQLTTEQKDSEQKIQVLKSENKSITDSFRNEIATLRSNYDSLKSESDRLLSVKDSEIEKLSLNNQKISLELDNLKNYVQNSMPTIETVKEMTDERQLYENEIFKLKSKIESLKNDNSSLQIRLKSVNEILTLQENQLESGSTNVEKRRIGLLNKWRCKVYELLIQLKSQEINFKQEKSFDQKEIESYRQQLGDQSIKTKILENIIEDKKAEISVLNSDVTSLNEQVSILKDQNENLESKQKQDLQSSMELKNFVDEIIKNYQLIEESFRTANKKLNHLDQRVEFAKNRLGVIKALYTSKPENVRGNILDMTVTLSTIQGSMEPQHMQQVDDLEDKNFVMSELKRVTDERDLLATKLQQDMLAMNDKLVKMKEEYELIIETLNNELKELRLSNDEKQDKIDLVGRQLEEKDNLYDDISRKYDELSSKFGLLKTELSEENEKCLRERESQFMEKLAKMDEKIKEARREQAKAVVQMRQMERSTNREKERIENLWKSSENYYKEHVKNLQDKLISIEKEKNILMNSLRQQGTIFPEEDKVNDYAEEITSFWMESGQHIEEDDEVSKTSEQDEQCDN
ncbi:coiled-coil alpha-helical rod 1 isoform X1, partial [Brachionus plicatilis]